MHKRKSIRILYVVHLFKYRGRKLVPIDIIKASGCRHQAKWRCLGDSNGCLSTASLCEMLRLMGWNNHRAPLGRPR